MYKRILVSSLWSNNVKSNFIPVIASKATFSSKAKLSSISFVCECVCMCVCLKKEKRETLCYLVPCIPEYTSEIAAELHSYDWLNNKVSMEI